MRQLLLFLRLAPRGANYETVKHHIAALGLDDSHLGRRTLRTRTDEEILDAVKTSRSLADVLRQLGVGLGGGTKGTLIKRIKHLNADISHFSGQGWRLGVRTPVVPARPIDEFLVDGRRANTHNLKLRMIAQGVKEARCEGCLRTIWNDLPIPLELDHVNGRRDDNRLANLRLLCPNCHAQTPTYRGRNIRGACAYP
jgi:hypothetical protein